MLLHGSITLPLLTFFFHLLQPLPLTSSPALPLSLRRPHIPQPRSCCVMDPSTSATSFIKWFTTLPPNTDPFLALKWFVWHESSQQNQGTGVRRYGVIWSLFAAHVLVLLLSLAGVVARYRKGTAWIAVKDDNGLWRPNPSIVTALFFALYSVCFMITIPTYTLVEQPSPAAFAFELSSYIPLALVFHFTTFATLSIALSSSSSNNLNHSLIDNPSRRRRSRRALFFALSTAFFFLLSQVPGVTLSVLARRRQQVTLEKVMEAIDVAANSGLGLFGLQSAIPIFDELKSDSQRLYNWLRITMGVYGIWGTLWMVVYIPTVIKLIATMWERKRRIQRGIRSLRLLDELVSADERQLEEVDWSEKQKRKFSTANSSTLWIRLPLPGLPRSPSSKSATLASPNLSTSPSSPMTAIQFSPPSSPSSPNSPEINWGSAASTLRPSFQRPRPGAGLAVTTSRTETRLEELELDLVKTKRSLVTIAVQLGVTTTMAISYLLFICIMISSSPTAFFLIRRGAYLLWTGWTFAFPALLSSALFLYFSLFGPTFSPPRNPSTPPTPTHILTSPPPVFSTPIFDLRTATPAPRPPTPPIAAYTAPAHVLAAARDMMDLFLHPSPNLFGRSRPSLNSSTYSRSRPTTADSLASTCSSHVDTPAVPRLSTPPPTLRTRESRRAGGGRTSRPVTAESLMDPKQTPSPALQSVPMARSPLPTSFTDGLTPTAGPVQGQQRWLPSAWAQAARAATEAKEAKEKAEREMRV